MNSSLFSSLPISEKILKVVEELGFKAMTPIQEQALPILLSGRDLIGQSKTGSGKTAAFAIPILQKIDLSNRSLQAIVICPTRELSTQVTGEFRKLARKLEGLQVLNLSGGQPARPQIDALRLGIHIAVGTSGRILDLLDRRELDFRSLKTLVLDEADKLLELGFQDEISAILEAPTAKRQTLFISATFPDEIKSLSLQYQKNPVHLRIEEALEGANLIEEIAYEVGEEEKSDLLLRVLQQHPAKSVLIFCNQKTTVDELIHLIEKDEVSCAALHGNLEQRDRQLVMAMFRNGSYRILVATDVAARGIDIDHLDLVINYDFPMNAEVYIHRIGRTGRAGREGVAVTLVKQNEDLKLFEIEKSRDKRLSRPNLGFKNQHGLSSYYRESSMKTLWISGGRKDKLRPGDILGALTREGAGLKSSEIGKIDVFDNMSLVAIASKEAGRAFEELRVGKIKGRKFQVRLI